MEIGKGIDASAAGCESEKVIERWREKLSVSNRKVRELAKVGKKSK